MRVGLVGVGRIGIHHAQVLARHPDVHDLLIADADLGRADAVAAQVGGRVVTLAEALAPGVDAVVIAAPTPAHAELIFRAAEAVPTIFCEKPVAADIASTRKVLDHVRARGAQLQVGFQRRFDAGFQAVRAAVARGEVGTVHTVRTCTEDPTPPPADYIARSGGLYRDCLVHDFDAIRFVTGQEVAEVFTAGANVGGGAFADYGDVDTGAALLRLSGGGLAVTTGGRYNGAGYDVRLEVAGTRGSVVAGMDAHVPLRAAEPGASFPPGRPWRSFLERFAAAYAAELAAFVDLALGRRANLCSGQDALAALLVAEACELSRAERRPVAVQEVA